jgi:hypothetical protein
MRQLLIIIGAILCLNVFGQGNKTGGMSATYRWLQILEDRQVKQDSTLLHMQLQMDSLQKKIAVNPVNSIPEKTSLIRPEKDLPWYTDRSLKNILIAGGGLLLLILLTVIILPVLIYRRIRGIETSVENDSLESNLNEVQPETQGKYVKEQVDFKPAAVKEQLDDLLTLNDRQMLVMSNVSLMELSILALRESECNLAYAALNRLPVSKEFSGVVRYLHRISACIFRGRMPSLEPVISEILQYVNEASGEIKWNISPTKEWLATATDLSSDQVKYLTKLTASVEKIISIHNAELK